MRLSSATLDRLPAEVGRPGYDRDVVATGVVHLGIGAFHRAHQAAVFDAALGGGDLRWGVVGVSLRSPAVRDLMAPQDQLYSLVERTGGEERVRILGAVRDVLVAPEDPGRVVAAMADPSVHLVTLTVTEKGYSPDTENAAAGAGRPRTAPEFVAAGLAARRSVGLPPFTSISCDNLQGNGDRLRAAVLAAAAAHDSDLAERIGAEAAFPNTMVNRIVPATEAADVAALERRWGYEDQAMVKTEPRWEWVVEDRFCGPRPDFAALGVKLTGDVVPWEEAKLRLLNGAHSAIAYLGGLAGIDTVDGFVALPDGRRFVERLWDEAEATLTPPRDLDVAAYRTTLMTRFGDRALAHRTRQIATDGSQKLPQRLVAPMLARRAAGLPVDALALAVAAWMRWQLGIDDAGRPFAVDDPLAAQTAAAVAGAGDASGRVRALLRLRDVFPAEAVGDAGLVGTLTAWLSRLEAEGARSAFSGV